MAVDARKGKVKVAGAAIAKKHRKAVPQMNIEGGIVELESWIDISNVACLTRKQKSRRVSDMKYATAKRSE
jgi:ribosomal protein L24